MPILRNPRIPRGLIMKWSGLISSIPSGWQLCDGTNNTPDMRSRFSRGVNTNGTDPGSTGGSDTVTLTSTSIPSHTHSITETAHNHTASLETTPVDGAGLSNPPYMPVAGAIGSTSASSLSGVSIGNTGSGSPHENRPTYYELLYIMKVSDI